ncbi:MAG: serpin family protein [Tannerella sp.]|jgi:serpin B|nr:serpin family protein [Tannerella sp.]
MKKMLFLFAAVFFAACDNGENEVDPNGKLPLKDPINIELSSVETRMAEEGQVFGMDFLAAALAEESDKENVVISPLSLNMALAMVWNGAAGETRTAIQEAMGMSNYQVEEVNAYFKKMKEALLETDPSTQLALANSIWAREGFPFKESFFEINRQWYDAKVSELDFADPKSVEIINQWCSDNTNGLIDKMIESIPDDLVMYLMNALYFKGTWSEGYGFVKSDTKDADFQKESGETVKVKMMGQMSQQPYYADENLSLTSLPYGNGAFRMVFVLPQHNVSFVTMIERLQTPDYLINCLNSAVMRDVNLFVPRFKIEYEIDLVKPLKRLGVGVAFEPFVADFSEMSDMLLYISEAKQKIYIEVNEEGTEAAAVTSIGISFSSVGPPQPVMFTADRPFLFLIQEKSSGAVLFTGKIGNAAE